MFNIGKFKTWYARGGTYIGIMNFLMLLYLTISENQVLINYLPFLLIGFLLLMIYDIKVIFPQENKYVWAKTPQMTELRQDMAKVLESIKKYEKNRV